MTDQDGNIYNTIIIGYQTWMAENLRVTHYRNGDEIPEVRSDAEWTRTTFYSIPDVTQTGYNKEFGLSVRCVKN